MKREYIEKLEDMVYSKLKRLDSEELMCLVVEQLQIHGEAEFMDSDLQEILRESILDSCKRTDCVEALASEIGIDYSEQDYEVEQEEMMREMEELEDSQEYDYRKAKGC